MKQQLLALVEHCRCCYLRITEYIKKRALDPSAAQLLKQLFDEGANNDKKVCALLLALNTVLPPIAAASRLKPTILIGQEDTLIFVDAKEQAQLKVQETYRSYTELNLPIVPKLIAVGKTWTSFREPSWSATVTYAMSSSQRQEQ
nr:uncharacterized protein LOC109402565 [Aedes albopictus]